MNKFTLWITIILIIIILILVKYYLVSIDINTSKTPTIIHNNQPNYQTGNAVIYSYNPIGILIYKLITDKIYHFSNNKISWIINPVLIIYDTKNIPTWTLRSNKAKLTNDNILYLHGNIQIKSLNQNSTLQQIFLENAIINLITKNILSNDQVTVIGIGLRSVGMKLRGNMQTRITEIIEDVKTFYTITK